MAENAADSGSEIGQLMLASTWSLVPEKSMCDRVAGNRNVGLDAKGRWALADPVDEVFRLVTSIGKRTDHVTHHRLGVIVQGLDIVCQRVGAIAARRDRASPPSAT